MVLRQDSEQLLSRDYQDPAAAAPDQAVGRCRSVSYRDETLSPVPMTKRSAQGQGDGGTEAVAPQLIDPVLVGLPVHLEPVHETALNSSSSSCTAKSCSYSCGALRPNVNSFFGSRMQTESAIEATSETSASMPRTPARSCARSLGTQERRYQRRGRQQRPRACTELLAARAGGPAHERHVIASHETVDDDDCPARPGRSCRTPPAATLRTKRAHLTRETGVLERSVPDHGSGDSPSRTGLTRASAHLRCRARLASTRRRSLLPAQYRPLR